MILTGAEAENLLKATALWTHFNDTPTHADENGNTVIDRKWFIFPAGTQVKTIEAWFEKEFHVDVDKDLRPYHY